MKRIIQPKITFLVLLGILGIVASCTPIQNKTNEWNCIQSFDDFLYQMTEFKGDSRAINTAEIYPSTPWEFVAELPGTIFDKESRARYQTSIEFTRNREIQTELWIRGSENDLVVFFPESGDYSLLSSNPSDENGNVIKDIVVLDIFQISNGAIFGLNYPLNEGAFGQNKFPLFSIYNESEHRFEFYDIGLKYSGDTIRLGWVGMIPRDGVIVANSDDMIWFYHQQDGLFSYDVLNAKLLHHQISLDDIVQRIAITPDGNVLLSQERKGSPWTLTPGEFIFYEPDNKQYHEIPVPRLRWPDYGKLLYTESGDLWIGIHGYLSIEGDWHLKNPSRYRYTNLGASPQSYNWSHPKLLIESSNGFLWYSAYSGDALGVHGAAWYDPETGAGSWFTTEAGEIIEDSSNVLWMIANSRIYKFNVNDE